MSKWLRVAIAGLALIWAPFLYKELTREGPATEADGVRTDDAFSDLEELEEEPVQVAPLPTHDDTEGAAPPEGEEGDEKRAEGDPAEAPTPAQPAAPPPPTAVQPVAVVEPPGADDTANDEAAPDDDGAEEAEEAKPVSVPQSGPLPLLKGVFEGETRDSLWASDREGALTELVAGSGFGPEAIGEISCMRTVCRVGLTVKHDTLKAMTTTLGALQAKHGPAVAVEPQPAGEDGMPIMVYIARQGYSLNDLAKK